MLLNKRDILKEKFGNQQALEKARKMLEHDDQTEEQFLGAQGILILHGLI